MAITLSVGPVTVALHPDLYWADELNWSPVVQAVDTSVTGALIVSVGTRLAGRPITLRPVDDSSAWMTRTALEQLQAWAATPGQEMALVLRGVSRTVLWRHHEPPALNATPVVHFRDVDSGDFYLATLNLIEV